MASFALDIPIQFLYRHPIVFTLSGDDFEKDIFIKEIVNFRHKSISLWNKISACPARKRGIPGWTVEDGLGTLFIAKILLTEENPGGSLGRKWERFPEESPSFGQILGLCRGCFPPCSHPFPCIFPIKIQPLSDVFKRKSFVFALD